MLAPYANRVRLKNPGLENESRRSMYFSKTERKPSAHWDRPQRCHSTCSFFLKKYFFKVSVEFVTILLLFYVLVLWPRGMWDLSSLTKDGTCTPCIGRGSLNHWTAREGPPLALFKRCFQFFSIQILKNGKAIIGRHLCNQIA